MGFPEFQDTLVLFRPEPVEPRTGFLIAIPVAQFFRIRSIRSIEFEDFEVQDNLSDPAENQI